MYISGGGPAVRRLVEVWGYEGQLAEGGGVVVVWEGESSWEGGGSVRICWGDLSLFGRRGGRGSESG